MSPLEHVTAGRESREKIEWTQTLEHAFKKAQEALSTCKTLSIPTPEDTLVITTDASISENAIGATMHCGSTKERTSLYRSFTVRS